MLGSAQSDGVILADDQHDCSLGHDQTRKLRAKPLRNGFNCLGFISVTVLNQRKSGNGLKRGARQGLQFVRELTCKFCCKSKIFPSLFVAHKRVGLKIHMKEKHKNEDLLPNSSQHHFQRRLNVNNHTFAWVEEVEKEVTVTLGKSLTKEMIEAVILEQSFQPEVILITSPDDESFIWYILWCFYHPWLILSLNRFSYLAI